ncbi:MAG TPA: polyprenyl synthetase family protein [Bacteroidia bacterium]|nr:polyprenyl synthetase family protein [Bacteroidia bacterium]
MNIPLYQQLIETELNRFTESLPAEPKRLYEPMRYTMTLGGKRMRPLLSLMGAGLFTDDVRPAIHAAIGIELFHNFTLLHDDIMDNAPLRRGKDTVYAKWNSNIAILSGDAMYTEAFRQVALSPPHILPHVLDIFTRTALEVCEGQQMDMDFETRGKVSIPEYIRMIELKTAVLLAGALEIGALCGGAYATEAHKLYEFGKHVGIAFQLQDDILDVYGDPEKFGKQVGGDIVSNKKTFLLISALEKADAYSKEALQNWMQVGQTDTLEKVKAVTAIYDQIGIRELAEKEMWAHYELGIASLISMQVDGTKKEMLRQFTDSLMVRES